MENPEEFSPPKDKRRSYVALTDSASARLLNSSKIDSAFGGSLVEPTTAQGEDPDNCFDNTGLSPLALRVGDSQSENEIQSYSSGIKKGYLFVSVLSILLGTA